MSNFLQDWLDHLQGVDQLPQSPLETPGLPQVGFTLPHAYTMPPIQVTAEGGLPKVEVGMPYQNSFTTQPITANIPADAVHKWLGGSNGGPNSR